MVAQKFCLESSAFVVILFFILAKVLNIYGIPLETKMFKKNKVENCKLMYSIQNHEMSQYKKRKVIKYIQKKKLIQELLNLLTSKICLFYMLK